MPSISKSTYKKPAILFNRHLETIVPGLLRNVKNQPYLRERIDTPDGDFLDLDWIRNDQGRLVILSHGLEGDSSRPYIKGMAKSFVDDNWDILAWNFRGCSGEMNRSRIFYHSGATYDLERVIQHAVTKGYESIVLIGFSLGGNITLKYLGEKETAKFSQVKCAVAFSVPLDLAGCSQEIDMPYNILYSKRFLKSLKKKVKDKEKAMPGSFNVIGLDDIRDMYTFDDKLTAPVHGFKGADQYYESCSSRNFLNSIKIRTLVVNALNDSFLSASCLDASLFKSLKNVYFETPRHGGHVGFSEYNGSYMYWSEKRALEFVKEEMENL